MYFAGVVCMILNRHSRRLGDFVAGTVVVHDRKPEDVGLDRLIADAPSAATSQGPRLTAEELVLVETFLQRRADLGGFVREARAAQIASRVTSRTGLKPADGQNDEDFLESIARQARDSSRFQ